MTPILNHVLQRQLFSTFMPSPPNLLLRNPSVSRCSSVDSLTINTTRLKNAYKLLMFALRIGGHSLVTCTVKHTVLLDSCM